MKRLIFATPKRVAGFTLSAYFLWSLIWFFVSREIVAAFHLKAFVNKTDIGWLVIFLNAALIYWLVDSLAGCLKRVEHEKIAGELRLNKTIKDIRTALDNSADVAITDRQGNIVYVNDRFCKLSKYSREELLGQNHRLLNSGRHSKEFFRDLWATISSGKVWRGEICNRTKGGALFWELTTITPILDESKKPSQYVVIRHDITERVIMEKELRDNEEGQRLAIEAGQLGMWFSDEVEGWVVWSPLCRRFLGAGPDVTPSYQAYMASIHPEDREAVNREIKRAFDQNGDFFSEHRVVWPDGSVHWLSVKGRAYRDEQGRPLRAVGVIRDVTEVRKAREKLTQTELQLRQSQKMEGIGRLAGGIAHDFNNLLTAISGYGHFLLDSLPQDDQRRADVGEIIKAGDRAAALTRQLLAFSRRQVLESKVLNPSALLAELEKMLGRIIGEHIELAFLPGKEVGQVLADPGQLEQAVVNLAVNARDAMPGGGRLTIETANVDLDAEYAVGHPGCAAGPHVMICVSDTGCGMSAEVKAHLFEPFFTTKGQGKGTGLGLATVYGIVRQSRGHIDVYSEVGHGTAFKIYLPRLNRPVEAEEPRPAPGALRGHETILLVEDDEAIYGFASRLLRESGYRVLPAHEPAEALGVCEREEAGIDLMLTDIVMPKMSGYALAERAAKLRPGMKVIFMSGYTDQSVVDSVRFNGAPFLQKPLNAQVVLRKIRDVLEARP